jgi:hypothetical protein
MRFKANPIARLTLPRFRLGPREVWNLLDCRIQDSLPDLDSHASRTLTVDTRPLRSQGPRSRHQIRRTPRHPLPPAGQA